MQPAPPFAALPAVHRAPVSPPPPAGLIVGGVVQIHERRAAP